VTTIVPTQRPATRYLDAHPETDATDQPARAALQHHYRRIAPGRPHLTSDCTTSTDET
jgi:hypothetical protein